MALTIKSFQNTGGAPSARQLVERGPSTAVAFIDHNWGSKGSEVTLIDQGVQAEQVIDMQRAIPYGNYPISFEVYSGAAGEFSVHDGSAWQGPFYAAADTPMAMLVRYSDSPSAENTLTVRVKFRALQASNRVLIQARQLPSAAQMAAI